MQPIIAQHQPIASDDALARELASLSQEREAINNMRVRAESDQARAAQDWAASSAQLKEEFGMDDLDAIEEELNARSERNTAKVKLYREQLAKSREEVEDVLQRQQEARQL